MSDVVFGCFSCIAFIVIVLFNVGCFTPNWIRTEEISLTNFTNFTNTSTVSTTTRTCHHGLLYSIDCPNSKNGKSLFLFFFQLSFSIHSSISDTCKTCVHSLSNLMNRIYYFELYYRYKRPDPFLLG